MEYWDIMKLGGKGIYADILVDGVGISLKWIQKL